MYLVKTMRGIKDGVSCQERDKITRVAFHKHNANSSIFPTLLPPTDSFPSGIVPRFVPLVEYTVRSMLGRKLS